jgi:hypothetical protein
VRPRRAGLESLMAGRERWRRCLLESATLGRCSREAESRTGLGSSVAGCEWRRCWVVLGRSSWACSREAVLPLCDRKRLTRSGSAGAHLHFARRRSTLEQAALRSGFAAWCEWQLGSSISACSRRGVSRESDRECSCLRIGMRATSLPPRSAARREEPHSGPGPESAAHFASCRD